jgi:hypothetical protein
MRFDWSNPLPTVGEFNQWLDMGKPGSTFVYHIGFLAIDRQTESGQPVAVVDTLARLAWRAHLRGNVVLVQARQGEGEYVYLAVKPRQQAKYELAFVGHQ